MRSPEVRTIGEHTYSVTPLPAGVGLRVFALLMRVGGPALANLKSLAELQSNGLAILAHVIENVDGELLVETCAKLAPYTTLDNGQSLVKCFDLHFQGDYLSLFEWLKFSLEVNFGPFFSGLLARVKAPSGSAAVEPQPSRSPVE